MTKAKKINLLSLSLCDKFGEYRANGYSTKDAILNMASYVSAQMDEVGLDAFDASFALAVVTGISKEAALQMVMDCR